MIARKTYILKLYVAGNTPNSMRALNTLNEILEKEFKGVYDEIACAEICGQYLRACSTDHTLELNQIDKERIFNLGYYTWVEQQGVDINDFEKRRNQKFWNDHFEHILSLDNRIKEFNNIN